MQGTEDQTRTSPASRDLESVPPIELESEGGVDFLAAIWRYKVAVFSPALFGLLVGTVLYLRLPETFESAARMLVESDQPLILESSGGSVIGGTPNSGVIQAQLFSDKVLSLAARSVERAEEEANFSDGEERPSEVLRREFSDSFPLFVSETLNFMPETDDKNQSSSVAFRMAVRHTNKKLAEFTVKALHDSFRTYFQDKREGTVKELKNLLEEALKLQGPKVELAEEEYRNFRMRTNLQWDPTGVAINPYRIEQERLKQKLAELQLELDAANLELGLIEETVKGASDPRTALEIVGQMLNKEFITPATRRKNFTLGDQDFDLRRLGFQEQLVPLIVERQKNATQLGENHPSVRNLDDQIKYSKEQFEKLSREFTDRIAQLLENSDKEKEEALVAAETALSTVRAKNGLLVRQIENVNQEIDRLKGPADALAAAEQENDAYKRKMERETGLLSLIEEQMARINLSERQPGIMLTSLTQPSQARRVGPNIFKCLGGGLFLGLLCGGILAYILEGQAATFRSAEEIENSLQATIFSHIPYDPGRRRKLKKGEVDPYEGLDDKLSVILRPSSLPAEAIRACRTNVFFEANASNAKVLQVTSPLPSDGKSTIAGNLAASIAQAGKRVILIDADLRRPQIVDNFAIKSSTGLTSVLNGDCEPIEAIHPTPLANLFVMPAGPVPLNPAEALTLPEMADLIKWLRDQYDYVIVDTPPLLAVTDPSIVAGLVDAVLLTLKIRRKSRSNAKEAVSILRSVGARILGIIVNASDDASGSDGYRGYGYYKYSRYASKYRGDYGYNQDRKASGGTKPSMVVSGRGPVSRNGVLVEGKVQENKSLGGSSTVESPAAVD